MKLALKTMKRVGALMLAFAMVVGILPVHVFAVEGNETPYEIKLIRTKNDLVDPVTYTYVVDYCGNPSPTEGSAKYYWDTYYQNNQGNFDPALNQPATYVATVDQSVAVKVVVDGLTLVAIHAGGTGNGNNVVEGPEAKWSAVVTFPENVHAGVPVTLPNAVPYVGVDKTAGSGTEGAEIHTRYTINGETYMDGEEYVFADEGPVTVSYEVFAGMVSGSNSDVLPEQRNSGTTTVNVLNPITGVSYWLGTKEVTSAGGEVWVQKAQNITVKVTVATSDKEVTLPNLIVDGAEKTDTQWTKDGLHYVSTVNWSNGEKSITFQEKTVNFKEDTVNPSIQNVVVYRDETHGHCLFDYVVGESGLRRVTVDQNTVNIGGTKLPYCTVEDNRMHIVFERKPEEKQVRVGLTNGAGATFVNHINYTPDMTLEITPDSRVKTADNFINVLLSDDYKYTVSVNDPIGTITAKLSDDTPVEVSGNTVSVGYATANDKSLTVTDSMGRTIHGSFPNLTNDIIAPDVTIAWPDQEVVAPNNDGVYRQLIQVTESGSGIIDGAKFEYYLNNASDTQSIVLAEGENYIEIPADSTLIGYKISGLKDAVGNEYKDNNLSVNRKLIVDGTAPMPHVAFLDQMGNEIAHNVFTGMNGQKTYVNLGENVTDNETIVMTIRITDDNLDTTDCTGSNVKVEEDSVTYTFTTTLVDGEGQIDYEFLARDLAKNVPTDLGLNVQNTVATLADGDTTGLFAGTLYIDRRDPVGTIEFAANADEQVKNSDEKDVDLFGEDFTVTVNQTFEGDVYSVKYLLDNGCTTTSVGSTANGEFDIAVKLPENVESKDVSLIVRVTDNAGNYTDFEYPFAIDTKAPEITIVDEGGTDLSSETETKYYTAQKVTVTVTDLFLSEAKVDGETLTISNGSATRIITLPLETEADGISVDALDLAGNPSQKKNTSKLVVDPKLPEVTLVKTTEEGKTINGAYANGDVTYTFHVIENYLDTIELSYTISGEEKQVVTAFTQGEKTNEYDHSFTVGNGKKLESYSIKVTDKAGNINDGVTGGENYQILVDTDVPVVTIERSGVKNTNIVNAVEYVTSDADAVTYTITVKDATITTENAPEVTIAVKNSSDKEVEKKVEWAPLGEDEDGVSTSFTLEDGEMLTNLVVNATDAATNKASETLSDAVVVDNTPPAAKLTFAVPTEGVALAGFVTIGEQDFLKLSYDEKKDIPEITATATLTVTDNNLYDGGLTCTSGAWTTNKLAVNQNSNSATFEQKVTVKKDNTATFPLDFTVTDAAGNPLVLNIEDINGTIPTCVNQNNGNVKIPLVVDFRKPTSGEAGENSELRITVIPNQSALTSANKRDMYYANIDELKFGVLVRDNNPNSENQNSGLDEVKHKFKDNVAVSDTEWINMSVDPETKSVVETVDVPEMTGENESNDIAFTLFASDKAGNGITHVKEFAVDTLAPRISVSYDHVAHTVVNEVKYYNAFRTATIKVEDINQGTTKHTVDTKETEWTDEKSVTMTQSVVFEKDGPHSLSVVSTDLAGNQSKWPEESFIIDTTAPVVTITKTDATPYTDGTTTDYYNAKQTYTITVTDDYLDLVEGGVAKANVSYTINGTGNSVAMESKDGSYSYEFTLTDGQTLESLSIDVVDNAGNEGVISSDSIDGFEGTGTIVYEGNKVCVDMTKPVLTIAHGGKLHKSWNKHDFHSEKVTFTLTVEDTNLNSKSSGFANAGSYTIEQDGKTEEPAIGWTIDGTTMTAEVTIENHQMLTAMSMTIFDAAGNPVKLAAAEGIYELFNADKGVVLYQGNNVVVDTTAPKATITLTSDPADQLVGFYTDAKGVTYVKLQNPTTDDSPNDTVKVIMTMTVYDYNLGIDKGLSATNGDWVIGSDGWSKDDKILINTNGSAVHTREVEVETNSVGQIVLDPVIVDMAGNAIQTTGIKITEINNTVPEDHSIKAEAGKVTGTISLDRRQPTSGDDNAAPYVELIPSVTAPAQTANGVELYNSSFSFALKVNDGANNDGKFNSGLKPSGDDGVGKVFWTLNNEGNGAFVSKGGTVTKNGSHNYEETISIDAGTGEFNDFELKVTAIDNVGNTITYVRNFAVDTQSPRITVVYDNNDVRNEKYFNSDRTATITVTDINFNASATQIDTEVTPSGWSSTGNGVHTATCEYTVDGDYTFAISSTDLANNTTSDDDVTYDGTACKEFVLDKTSPVINVTYSDEPSGTDDNPQADYYNKDLRIGVSITEHNFYEPHVEYAFFVNHDQPLNKNLSAFKTAGDEHEANIDLENGNFYNFYVNYTDLAGNIADSYTSKTFTVDTIAPTITVESSTLKEGQMNVVSGDMDLKFVIEDAEENLRGYEIVITHMNNQFQSVVVSGPEYLTVEDAGNRKTITINIANIQKLKEKDGIYTIQLKAYDFAGNVVNLTPDMLISLNRFGSTFTAGNEFTKQFLTPGSDGAVYHNSVDSNLVIQEINPNRVFNDSMMAEEGSSLTTIVNGRSIRLEKDVDYTLKIEEPGKENGTNWYVYTYEIDKKVFEENEDLRDGRYSILIYGVDEAMNNNTNESSQNSTVQKDAEGNYTGKIEFVIDTQAPVIITTGIESNKIYNAEHKQMEIEISDSTPAVIQVYLNEQLVAFSDESAKLAENKPWLIQDKQTGIYTLNVNEQAGIFDAQDVRIVAVDAASNTAEAEINGFHVSTNFIIRLLNSIWFYVILAGAAATVITLVFTRKKKKVVV